MIKLLNKIITTYERKWKYYVYKLVWAHRRISLFETNIVQKLL